MRAIAFVLVQLATGRPARWAVICLEARYASVLWLGAGRLDRRHALPAVWKAVAAEIALGIPPGPIDRSSALAGLLGADRSDVALQYVSAQPIAVDNPSAVVLALDSLLRLSAPNA
jgi:hypothetical protein